MKDNTIHNASQLNAIRNIASVQCFLSEFTGTEGYRSTDSFRNNVYSWGISIFLDRIGKRLDPRKYKRFVEDFKSDAPDVYRTLLQELKNVYFAEDRFIRAFFKDDDDVPMFEELRGEQLKDVEFFEKVLKEAIISPNSVAVFLPDETGNFSVKLASPAQIQDVTEDEAGAIDYLCLKIQDGYLTINSESFLLLDEDKNTVSEIPNIWGYVPATFLMHDRLYGLVRKPFTHENVPQFFRYITHQNNRDYFQLYASYPIMYKPEDRCDYKDQHNTSCNGYGKLYGEYDDGVIYESDCPSCEKRALLGAGTVIEIPADVELKDVPIGFINVDGDSLNFHKEVSDELENKLLTSLIGNTAQAYGTDAYNEAQVAALNEKKQQVLRDIARNLEKTHKFILEAFARLHFPETYSYCTVNYGRTFIVKPADTLVREYTEMRKEGAPQYLLTELLNQAISVKFRTNPITTLRMQRMQALEPFLNTDINQLIELNRNGVIDNETLSFKLNFTQLISRFELKYGRIELFGMNNANKDIITANILQILKQIHNEIYTRPVAELRGQNDTLHGINNEGE